MPFFVESDFFWTIFATETRKHPNLIDFVFAWKEFNIFYSIPIKILNQDG